MALMLTSSGLLARAKRLASSGPARSGVISGTAAGVGLAAGKSDRHKKKIVIGAVAVGAAANLVGMNTIGDGLMAGGASLLGYKLGSQKTAAPAPVAVRPLVKKGFFRRG